VSGDIGGAAIPFETGERENGTALRDIAGGAFVPESRFGRWFLNTRIWSDYVLEFAVADLRRLTGHSEAHYPVVLDAGCAHGRSFPFLMNAFHPQHLIAIDRDRNVLANAVPRAALAGPAVTLIQSDCGQLSLPDNCVDLIFCHQTLHHTDNQSRALREFHRVLKPAGVLLCAETTRAYIEWWIIRLLFSHPMQTQRTAGEYLSMLRAHGFTVAPDAVSLPYPWWSRRDLGGAELFLRIRPPPPGQRDETLLHVAAVKA
jgi:SAM-dependent methyltransferase